MTNHKAESLQIRLYLFNGRRYIAVDIPLHANQNVYNLFVLPLTFPKKQASYYFK